jgi:hypothetical protein
MRLALEKIHARLVWILISRYLFTLVVAVQVITCNL